MTTKAFDTNKKNLFLEVFLFLIVVLVVNLPFQFYRHQLAIKEVCDIISNNYLETITKDEYISCLNVVSLADFSNKDKIKKINMWLRQYEISHFYIYNEKENQKMWRGHSRETGIVAKNIFNKWKVVQVLVQDSPIKVGDEILLINEKKVKSANQIANTQGSFFVLRAGEKVKLNVEYSDVVYNEKMQFHSIDSEWTYLKIPSFKSEFFGYDELARIYKDLHNKKIVIDIRDNFGGNFISTIRLLSMLMCTEEKVGSIFHNRTEFLGTTFLKDDLSDYQQILQVTQTNPVFLKLFKTELCLNSDKLIVIINEKTSSVSELFVQILKNHFKNLKVYGINTAGQMVLSIWYPLKYMGPEVLISIPYAWATANDKHVLEGSGASPTESINTSDLEKYSDSLDPLLDYVIEKEGVKAPLKSSLGGLDG